MPLDEISGLAIIKILELKTSCTNTIKVRFIRNTGFHDVTNNSSEPLLFTMDEALGIVDLRSIGYYRVKQGTIQHPFLHHYESHSIFTGHCYTFFKLPSETYRVVTRSQTKAIETQRLKMHGADKLVDPALKPETQDR